MSAIFLVTVYQGKSSKDLIEGEQCIVWMYFLFDFLHSSSTKLGEDGGNFLKLGKNILSVSNIPYFEFKIHISALKKAFDSKYLFFNI